jgi:hypothetical protein
MGDHTPRRKASIASSASSGATIKPTNRQNSGSNGFFARFRSSSQSRSTDGYDDIDGEGNGWEPEAGPSDYYRRSPSPPPPPPGWRTASTEVYVDSEEEEQRAWEAPYDSWNPNWRDEQSDAPTPDADADESMSLDVEEYQKRLRDVLKGSRVDTPEQADDVDGSEGIQDNGVERVLEKTGIGEEEFGVSSPSSSPPSTPRKTARQVSYIRKSTSVGPPTLADK